MFRAEIPTCGAHLCRPGDWNARVAQSKSLTALERRDVGFGLKWFDISAFEVESESCRLAG